ncbi:probable helicase senataxin isoform X2 [Misgurnus anguillicaudatus]|uniref:probable helicase senataxin isoform X2 n=1 Tax=Misgurnus anguillicaudatus TaxID=75329 RepID=UPI003CCFD549
MMEKCMWCTTSLDVEGDEAIRTLLRRYSSGKLSEREMDSLNEDLSCCMECVVEYHRSREKVPELHKVLWEMEKTRLLRVLGSVLDQELEEDDDLFIIEDDGVELVSKMSPIEFQNSLRFPLFEVLKYPYLLCYRELCDMAVKALCMLQDMNHSLPVFEKYQGTYMLLVHPNEKVRRWAIDAAKTMKSVDRDAYYDLQEIFTCMFYVIELGFCVDLPASDPDSYAGGSVPRLPSHLYDSHNKKNYWLGICMLLTQLSAEAMDSLFMGQFNQFNIPLCILNTMDELKHEDDPASDPFWPALQCFMVILDRLGSKIWGQVDPILAFQTITGAASYTAEIRNIQKKTTRSKVKVELDSDDNMVTCSQMVYDCYASGKKSQASSSSSSSCISNNYVIYEDMQSLVNVLDSEMGQSMRVYGSTFLWFIPFVRSLMELAELNASYISEVIHYLCDKIQMNRHMLTGQANMCDRVTEFFTRILIQIVELHFNEGKMGKLYRCAPKWVEVIVMCSVLSDEAFSAGLPDRMGGIHRVSSTSNTLGVVGRLPASGDGVGAILVGCITLIRLLLKEGIRTGSDPRSTHYLNLLNKQLRRVPNSRWELTKSESDELERCLKNIVRSMPARPASPATFVSSPSTSAVSSPSIEAPTNAPLVKNTNFHKLQHEDSEAGPSKAGDASAPIKQETLYDCLSDEDFFSGFESLIEAKKEPCDPVVSDPRPAVELACIKPDLGVLQEIRSRLNNNKNLSKIKAIAQGKPGLPEVGRVGSGQKEPTSSHPLTLQPVTTSKQAETTKKCGLRSEVVDDDNEPLDIRRDRLRKSWKLESSDSEVDCMDDGQKHTMSTSKESFSTIIISDDETSENDEEPTKKVLRSNEVQSPVLPESPGRDYDDLSESQVFEFETQQYVASAWEDLDIGASKKPKLNSELKPQVAPVPDEGSPSWSSETEAIQDEDIERACQQAEEKIRQQQQLQKPSVSCASSSSSKISSVENRDQFIKPQILPVKNRKTVQSEKKDIVQSKKPLLIEALAQKVRRHSLKRSFSSPDVEEPPSTSTSSSGLSSPSKSSSHISDSTSRGIPAVVPPKKVRKAVEPESSAERLGLKKKERKAFDLSQRSLDSVAKLRGHGQKVQVEPQQKKRRISSTKSSPQKRLGKSNKKLLASQDMQFIRQSRDKRQRPAGVSNTSLAPKPTMSNQPGEMHLSKPTVAEQEDFDFLPCPKEDPDHQQNNKRPATEMKTNHTSESCNARVDIDGCNETESKYFRSSEFADVAVNTERNTATKDAKEEEEEEDDEWMFLTQMEPTDMELCSQMEQFEGNDDPVDMDLDDAVGEPETPVQLALPTNKPLPSLQDPNIFKRIDSNNDNLFLKPGMSPMSQKKAKPSTTKIYAPSSRSASLVLEMEKGDKPPPVVNVAKAKNAQLAPAMPPPKMTPPVVPPQFAQPLPSVQFARPLPPLHFTRPSKPIHRPLSHAPKSVTSTTISSTSEPPSYKTYQRPEAPVNKPVPKLDPSQKFDVSVLTQAILKWEFSMFDNFKTFGSPDDLCQLPLKEVPVKFTSYLEYFNTLYPLLLINAFEEMVNEWLKQGRIEVRAQVQGMEYSNRTASASFVAKLSREQERRQLYPKEDDLVLLHLPENIGAYAHDEPAEHHVLPHFGYVSRSSVSNRGPEPTVNMTIQTRGNVSSVNTEQVRCEVIGSLISTFREFRALCLLRNGPMLRPLLAPHVSYFKHSQDTQLKMDAPEYNADQSRAIDCGLAMIKRTQKTPKFLLIHGPPGTGKSKTIGGLLYKLLSSDINSATLAGNFPSKTRRTRVLLCAPSNAAIDSLMKKVIVVFKEKCRNINSPQGNCGDINLVRLGSEKTISKILKPFSLDHQIRARAQRTQQTVEADIQKQKELLDQEIEVVSKHCAKAQKGSSEFKRCTERKMELLREMEGLSRKIKECRGKRQESQALVLQNAHVICCTLSTSGSTVLENAFRRLGHEPFSCVIIDEASQAKETETLIPMLYRCPAVILVGDPNQLPPTVVSQKAKELGYDQSLMVRLCKSLQSNSQPSPVFLLSMQYRMHPDICEFPSKYIYNNTLKNDCETAQKRCSFSWPFKPYRVFDVTDGRENKEGDSFSNQKEVKLVLMLLKLLSEKQSVRVGVITPYNAQKRKIMDAMRKPDFECKHLQVEVDTVDGFQGREMDCIIVSCVRASSEMGSIGFLGNRQRLNVTITRAKFSLFILGHLRTLREQSDWGALIDDAKRRGTIIKTQERDYQSDVRKILKRDLLSRSLSHPPVGKPSTVTSPVPHVPVETGRASTSRPHPSAGLLRQQSIPRPIPLDCPRDPQITDRPTDPRFAERRPIGEQRQDVDGRGLSMSHQRPTDPRFTERRPFREDYRNAAHSSRHTSKRFASPKRHRR